MPVKPMLIGIFSLSRVVAEHGFTGGGLGPI